MRAELEGRVVEVTDAGFAIRRVRAPTGTTGYGLFERRPSAARPALSRIRRLSPGDPRSFGQGRELGAAGIPQLQLFFWEQQPEYDVYSLSPLY